MTEAALRASTVADMVAIQCALASMIGGLASGWWLRRATSAWARDVVRTSRHWFVAGALLAIAADGVSLWLQAVVLLDDPGATLGPAMVTVLRETHFGRAVSFGLAALLVALVYTRTAAGVRDQLGVLAVAAFAASRSVVSHAGEQGDFSLRVGVDAIHLVVVCLWVGIVLVGVGVALRRRPRSRAEGVDAVRWISAMSHTATVALCLIVLTGVLKVAWATPSLQLLVASTYGRVLAMKLVLVGTAVAFGGFNRFQVMPGLLRSLVDPAAPTESLDGRFNRVLRLEAVVLGCAVIAAAVLGSTATPGEG